MKQLLLLLFFAGYYTTVNAGKCTRPYLSRQKVYIYSTIGKVPVKISRCLFNDTKDSYSDISNNCIKAFQSGIFVDKWDEKNILEDKFSPIVLEEYVSKADLVKNEVSLRSGRTCRYDRGFCYDPTETNTYAIVWEILEKSKEECPSLLYKVFEGDVDIWDFKPQGLSYLFYYDAFDDEAFYLGMEKKGQCQESDVWYTKEGYVVSVKPLVSKDMEKKASLILPKQGIKGGIKGGVKGGVKGGNMWGKLVERNDEYFSLRTKKTVSELILKNCDIRSLSIQELNEEVDSDYLENPHNLHLILERYYNLIKATKEELLEMIKKQNTLEITKELKEKLITLSQHFDETKLEVKEIQEILAGAGNLKGIRADLDDLAAKVVALLKKHEEYYDVIVKEIQESIKNNSKNINDQSLEIKIFSDKLEEIRNIIGKQIPEFITKTEVYEKINKVEQDFHEKLKDLVMNVTLILLNKDANVGGDGINGKNTERLAMENLIVDKLKSYNVDQFQTALDGLNDKIKLLLEQLRSETNMNVTTVEEKLLKKLADLAAQNEPILARLDKYGDKMNKLFLDIKDFKVNLEEHIVKTDLIAKDTESQIKKIFETFEEYDKFTLEIKKELKALSEKEVDFNPVYEKVHMIIDESLKPIDERLQLLEVISVNLGGYLDKNIEDVGNLTKDINDIRENLTKLDSLKGEINENLQKEVVTIQTKIEDVFNLHEALAKKVSEIDQDLQTSKNIFMSELLNATLMCEGAVMFVNLTALENRDMIEMLKNQNDLALMSFDELKQLVVNQGLALNEIEARSKEDTDKAIAEHDKTNEIINTLKENITDIYDILKFQEDSILILKKSCGKSTKGGYTKGGVKTSSLFNPLRPEATLDYEWGNLGSRSISYTKTKRDVDDNYGDYYEHGHSSALTENDLSLIVETQKTEIKSLRKQLFQTQDTLNKHEQRIEYLEAKIDKLINRRD